MARNKTDAPPIATPATSATPRNVRGLLDVIEAEAKGDEWKLENPSADFVPGMGLGATKQATRWAWLGLQAEMTAIVERAARRPAHRPRKHAYESKDAHRAFALWRMCKQLRETLEKPDAKITTRELIRVTKLLENSLGVPSQSQTFTSDDKTSEQSVSRGKASLKIDANWNSEVCEELWCTFSQTT